MAISAKNALRITGLVVIAGVLAWRHLVPQVSAEPATAIAPAAAKSVAGVAPATSAGVAGAASAKAPATPKPAPPRTWKLGELTLTSCELKARTSGASTAAWCNDFDVPENRANPDGRHIKLHLAVIRSDAGDAADKDMVLMLAGGPGEAATKSFQNTSWYRDILKHHHVVLFDQRGTGDSNPLSCPKTEKASKKLSLTTVGLHLDLIKKTTAECLAEVEKFADPRFYTTTDAAADIEAVRKALGSPKFDIIGVSYGTRMAQQYLMHYPDGVRSVVLDSPVPNQLILGADFAKNLHSALAKHFAACVATPACKKRFGDPMKTLYQLRDALKANPHQVTFRDPRTYKEVTRMLSADTLAAVVRMFAYSAETAALLPLSIDEAAHGNVGPLLGQAEILNGNLNGDMNGGMSMSVICSEDADLLKPDPADANTILGNNLVDALKAQCSVWPRGSRPADFHAPLKSGKPILILSGELDPVTPPAYGKEILKGLSNARQLIVRGQGHAEFARGCMPKLIGEFIAKTDPKGLDASCLKRMRATPAFINFNGAAP